MGRINIQFQNDVHWEQMPQATVLHEHEVHVYRVRISCNLHLINSFKTILTPAENERGTKYLQLKDRQRFVISRGAQRHILAGYLGLAPEDLGFSLGYNKKPYLTATASRIQYNITHAGDWIVLAVSLAVVGVDVEHIDDKFRFLEILEDNFSTEEVAFIKADHATKRFFLLWTRKEAFLKATGQGLDGHLKITPSLDGEQPLPTGLLGADKVWNMTSLQIAGDYFTSVAIKGDAIKITFFDTVFNP